MKAIKILFLLFSITLYSQDKVKEIFPKMINPTDTLTIGGISITGKSLWIDYTKVEIDQRFKIRTLESKIFDLKSITSQIDTTTIKIGSNFESQLIQKDLQIDKAETTIMTLGDIVQNQSTDIHDLNISLVKEKKKTGFWKVTAIVLGSVSITSLVILTVQ